MKTYWRYYAGKHEKGQFEVFRTKERITCKEQTPQYKYLFGPYYSKSQAIRVAKYQGYGKDPKIVKGVQ